jgi:hypothetical protein
MTKRGFFIRLGGRTAEPPGNHTPKHLLILDFQAVRHGFR